MGNYASYYIETELANLTDQLKPLVNKSKHLEVENLVLSAKSKILDSLAKKFIYVRNWSGFVSMYPTIEEAAAAVKLKPNTLKIYLSTGEGLVKMKRFTVSTLPLTVTNADPDPDKLWVRFPSGSVAEFKDLEAAAKSVKLMARTLNTYLSVGKGVASTKNGIVSRTPLTSITNEEAFEVNFHAKHGRWPEDHEIPKTSVESIRRMFKKNK